MALARNSDPAGNTRKYYIFMSKKVPRGDPACQVRKNINADMIRALHTFKKIVACRPECYGLCMPATEGNNQNLIKKIMVAEQVHIGCGMCFNVTSICEGSRVQVNSWCHAGPPILLWV